MIGSFLHYRLIQFPYTVPSVYQCSALCSNYKVLCFVIELKQITFYSFGPQKFDRIFQIQFDKRKIKLRKKRLMGNVNGFHDFVIISCKRCKNNIIADVPFPIFFFSFASGKNIDFMAVKLRYF